MLTAFGSTVYIINRTFTGTPTAANYMEQTLSTSSGAFTALITTPTQRDVMMEPGHYLAEDRFFHIASGAGAVANQFDWVQIAGTGDFYVVSENVSWYIVGQIPKLRILGRRIKTT